MTEEEAKSMGDLFPDLGPEAPVISGIAHDRSEALATVRGVPNEPGMAAKVFTELATAGVNVDMIVQAGASVGTADISFTVPEAAVKQVQNTLLDKQDVLGYHSFDVDTNVGKVAVVGVGMKTHSGLAAKFFQALSDEGINVLMISTSEIRIAALVPLDQLNDAVKALHTAYGLDADQIEAVVYGGTGRGAAIRALNPMKALLVEGFLGFEGRIWPLPDVYFHFEGLLECEAPSINGIAATSFRHY